MLVFHITSTPIEGKSLHFNCQSPQGDNVKAIFEKIFSL